MKGQVSGVTAKRLVRIGRNPDDCWEWLGVKTKDGYGRKTFGGVHLLAHRWMWMQLFGPLPEGLVVSQKCQNHGCVNPHHLRVTTQADAIRGGVATTLTPLDVQEIRAAKHTRGPNTANALAARYGCRPTNIRDIWRGKSWRRPRPMPTMEIVTNE